MLIALYGRSLLQVVCNTVTLAMDYYMIPDSTVAILSQLNVIFSSIFLGEMVLKLTGACHVTLFPCMCSRACALVHVSSLPSWF
jgi:hypothetical protein